MTDKRLTDDERECVLDAMLTLTDEVIAECGNQLDQWGVQEHELTYGPGARREFARGAEKWKAINAARVETGRLTWDGILLEEVYEALSEEGSTLARAELVQVAAVAVSAIFAIDQEAARTDTSPLTDDEIAADNVDGDDEDES